MIQKLILGPIELLLDAVYAFALRMTGSPGFSIVILSLAVNLIILPLYRRADAIQKEEQERTIRMKPRIDQIKAAFTGNERFMILQTYYRQNHYKPYYVLKSSVSLLLQIPFFMAAYRFLSGLQILQGVSFGPIRNLGAPDGMLRLGGISVNLLPLLMTAVNVVSGTLYSRGLPLKSKIQMYGLALVFLALLYGSPSGLVFYWTLNNVFSLLKNAAGGRLRIRRRGKAEEMPARKASFLRTTAARVFSPGKAGAKQYGAAFWSGCAFLALLTGLLIPSEVIKSSPDEFVNLRYLLNPNRYLLTSLLLATGTFVIWSGIYYKLSGKKTRRAFAAAAAAGSAAGALNFMAYGKWYGDMSSLMEYERPIVISAGEILLNLLILAAVTAAAVFLVRKAPGLAAAVLLACCVSLIVTTVRNTEKIDESYRENQVKAAAAAGQEPEIHLSRTGKNVVVFMLDRGIGGFVPYILNEKPEVAEQFDGFTYYPNTLSFGYHTIIGAPGMYGGYEYIPDEMNARSDECLVDKHNEALKVMPVLFLQSGYDVTVMNPSLAGYQWIPDLTIYDDYPEIHRYYPEGKYSEDSEEMVKYTDQIRNRNLFCYSLFRISPLLIRTELYNDGQYNETDTEARLKADPDSLIGVEPNFLQNYWVMQNLIHMTKITEDEQDCFLMMASEETHDITTLQEPDYVPKAHVDNSAYEAEHGVRVASDGSTLDIGNADIFVQQHYQCNMAAFMQLSRWFRYLKENGAWDNTRIILVADHAFDMRGMIGIDLSVINGVPLKSESNDEVWTVTGAYEPILMVKDFGAKGFRTDTTFRTNADTPILAFEGTVENPVNPFTGKAITAEAAEAAKSGTLHLAETDYHVERNTGNTFTDPQYLTFKGQDVTDPDNWYIGYVD